MKIFLYKTFIVFFLILQIASITYCDDIDEETIDTSLEQEIVTNSSTNEENIPTINSRSAVVLDRISKVILYGKNEKNKVKMASTTKIMTAIVVIENTSLDQTVEVSRKSAGTGGSRLGLKTGDKITIRDLLYGLMLCSGNDAAVCLAESVAGSIPEFSNLMNAKAKELQLSNSHFESPHGLDSDEHYTTAYELALLSDYALKNSTFKQIVGTKNYTVTINGSPKTLSNTNELLGNLHGIYGIKTGFTNGANRCLVTACKRGNMDIICVVLGADTKSFRTKDSVKLIEYAFKTYEYMDIKNFVTNYLSDWQNINHDFFSIEKGVSNKLEIKINDRIDDFSMFPIKKDLIPHVEASLSLTSKWKAPVQEGHFLGKLHVFSQDTTMAEFDLFSANTVRKNNMLDYMLNFLKLYPEQLENCIF